MAQPPIFRKKAEMLKWMIASDIHGSASCCQQLLERFQEEHAERLLLLGDLLYHGPRNELPEKYAPKEVIAMLNAQKSKLMCVRGNCDAEVDQMVLQFPVMADYAILEVEGILLYATHGHIYNEEHRPPLCPGDVLLQGHTHIPSYSERDGILCLNPGSVSIPKDGSARSYMTLENGVFYWKTLSGEIYRSHTL